MNKAYIFAAGEYSNEDLLLIRRIKIDETDLVIAADGGYKITKSLFIKANVYIGDKDSYSGEIEKDVITKIYPEKKDDSDLQLSINYALDQGYKEIILLGVLGGRTAHSYNAIDMLGYIALNKAEGMILKSNEQIYFLKDNIKVSKGNFNKLSILPITSKLEGITTTGLTYPLNNDVLNKYSSRGISNEFSEEFAQISIEKGAAIVILEKCVN